MMLYEYPASALTDTRYIPIHGPLSPNPRIFFNFAIFSASHTPNLANSFVLNERLSLFLYFFHS